MDGIDLLRREALLKRNAAILKAKREYHAALKEINALRGKLRIRPPGRPRKVTEDPLLKPTAVARDILFEGKAMTIMELTIEAQRRGCRSSDDPRVVAHATVRMTLRRFTRLTNAHSKSLKHHTAMQALFVAWYNFARKHEALKNTTPAMASGLSDHVWTIKELIEQAGNA
jgi:hypothetical protein